VRLTVENVNNKVW